MRASTGYSSRRSRVVVDRRQGLAKDREIFHRFVDAVIVDVVTRCLRPEDEVIANVLLDEAVAIVAANHWVGQVHVLDLGLQLASILLADFASTTTEDEVVAA